MLRSAIAVLCIAPLVAACVAADVTNDADAGPHKEVIGSSSSVFSPAIRTGNLIFLSGALGTAPGQGLVDGGVGPETTQALENLRQRLEPAGATMDDVVKCTVFLADIGDYRAMNQAYGEFFGEAPPTRSTVAVGGLVNNAAVEIECIAAVAD